jgi:Domain of unknown function (DUF5658)
MADSLSQQQPVVRSVWQMLCRPLSLQRESALFLMVSVLDVVMTYLLLTLSGTEGGATFYESNPIARYFFLRWNVWGIVYFKFANVAVVEIIAHIVATKNVVVARRLLDFGTLVVATVVIYSMLLMVSHQ